MPNRSQALQLARARIGSKPASRIQWLLEFAKLDLLQVNEQDLLLVQQQILVFLEQVEDVLRDRLPIKEQLVIWQEEFTAGLKKLCQGGPWKIQMVESLIAVRKEDRVIDSSTRSSYRQDHWPFTFHAINTLIQGADSLRFCANAKCSQLYVRNRRQGYCSVTCRDAVNKRLYRQRVSRPAHNDTPLQSEPETDSQP